VDLARAQLAAQKGNDAEAERELRRLIRAGSTQARLSLAELLLLTGRSDELLAVLPAATPGAQAILLRARAKHDLGEVLAALDELSRAGDLAQVPLSLRLEHQVARGTWLLERGRKQEAEDQLLVALEAYGQPTLASAPEEEQAAVLVQIGRAAHLLGGFQDANRAYEEAEALAPASVELLHFRAELFLEKYDTGHAREVLDEAAKLAPRHPHGLFLSASLELETSMNFALAGALCRQALARNPRTQPARALLAGIALRDLDFTSAERLLAEGLAQRPGDLELLSVAAAVRFLAEDEVGFEGRVEEVLRANPTYARIFLVVSEFAEWEHRYPDMERLLRRAARLDPENGAVRGRLGLTLVRAGSDSAGIVELRRAFELDPYDVRVLNTLQLFETILPARYVERREGPFGFRLPKEEEALLMRYVPALLDEAYVSMQSRYGFTPRVPTTIEIYESKEHFAVRTSGLPQIGIAGVCFGNKLATVSPRGSPANLGMTLWHELAHVFHIGLSKSRVPRWLTEGLAEWETARLGRGWSRELDPELWQALEHDRLPALASMNRAFTQAERLEDIAVAYYASGRMAGFLVEHAGMPKVRDLLASLGERGLRPGALGEVLGESPVELDRQFRAWVRRDLGRYEHQFMEKPRRGTLEQATKAGLAPNAGRPARLELARAELETGRVDSAEARLDALLAEGLDAETGYVLAQVYLATERADRGLALLDRVFAAGADGAELRLLAARLHLARQELPEATVELGRAGELDPTRAETWALLASVERQLGRTSGELRAVRNWAALSEHDGAIHRRLLELVLLAGPGAADEASVTRAIWTDLSSAATHRLAARVFERLGQSARADFEWEAALLCPSEGGGQQAEIREEWAGWLERRGQRAKAAKVRRLPPQ
jgi:tetratricopeptide (TPR) repeat protein